MNYNIKYNGTDISEYIIDFEREHQLCTGIGTAKVNMLKSITDTYTLIPYGVIEIYEDSTLAGTYYIDTLSIDNNNTTYSISCQDESKKLSDYFIAESYTVDYLSYTKYWISKFLTEAGVNYVYDTSEIGSPITNDTTLGLCSAIDIITQLVQQSGWYFRVDENGVFRIGKVDTKFGNEDITLPTEDEIISVKTVQNDNNLRNRVVVWGASNEDNGEWVFAESKTFTPYNYDKTDLRTAVLSSGNIYKNSDAKALANKILKETEQISYIKEVELAGFITANVGQTAYLDCRLYTGWALITGINVNCTIQGVTTILTLDERCPRLFGYFGYKTNYVYIGTDGQGVWRKPFSVDGWENFSTGLGDLHVTDLAINKSIFACTTEDGSLYARKGTDNPWYKLNPTRFITTISGELQEGESQVVPSGMSEESVAVSGLLYSDKDVSCMACDIDRATNTIYGIYTINDMLTVVSGWLVPASRYPSASGIYVPIDAEIPETGYVPYSGMYWHSWMVSTPDATTGNCKVEEIFVNGSNDVYAYDVTHNGDDVFISCLAKIPNNPRKRYTIELQNDDEYTLLYRTDPDTAEVETYSVDLIDAPDTFEFNEPPWSFHGNCVESEDLLSFTCAVYEWIDTTSPGGVGGHDGDYIVTVSDTIPLEENTDLFDSNTDTLFDIDEKESLGGTLYGYNHEGNYIGLLGWQCKRYWYHGVTLYNLIYNVQFKIINGSTASAEFLLYIRDGTTVLETYQSSNFISLDTSYIDADISHTSTYLVGNMSKVIMSERGQSAYYQYPEDYIPSTSPIRLYIYNAYTLAFEKELILKMPDGSNYLPGYNNHGYWILHDLDPLDEMCYALPIKQHFDSFKRNYYGEMVAFDLNTGIIHRIYPIHNFDDYQGGHPSYIYKNNIYSRYFNNEYYSSVYDYVENQYYKKFCEFNVTNPSYTLERNELLHGVAKRTDKGDYILLTRTPVLTHLEASTVVPLLAFGGNDTTGLGFLRIFQLGIEDENLDEYTYLHSYSPVAPVSTLMEQPLDLGLSTVISEQILIPSYIPDARVFNWTTETVDSRFVGFTKVNPSGIYDEYGSLDHVQYSGIGYIYTVDYLNDNTNNLYITSEILYQMLEVCSGVELNHMETTNYQDVPYLFASTMDTPSRFFEKEAMDYNAIETAFEEFNLNIPSSGITCIRCDDRI